MLSVDEEGMQQGSTRLRTHLQRGPNPSRLRCQVSVVSEITFQQKGLTALCTRSWLSFSSRSSCLSCWSLYSSPVVFGPNFHSKNWAVIFFCSSSNKNCGKVFAVLSIKKNKKV
jgi:hypothetical protein